MAEDDLVLERSGAKNLREYFKETREMRDMLVWIWKDLMSPEGKKFIGHVSWALLISAIIEILNPISVRMVIDGLSQGEGGESLIVKGFVFMAILYVIKRLAEYCKAIFREFLFDKNLRKLSNKTSLLFFEKSLGAHTSDSPLLNESTVRKGHDRVQELQNMMAYEGLETILNLLIAFIAVWVLDVKLGLTVTAIGLMHVAWSTFLNQRMLRDCSPIEKRWRHLTRHRTERWNRVERVKISGRVEAELDYMEKYYQETVVQDRKFWIWFIRHASIRGTIAYAIGNLAIVAYGAYLVYTNQMSLGWIWPWISYSKSLVDNLWRIGDIEQKLNFFTPYIMALKNALSFPIGITRAANPVVLTTDNPCRIEFHNVSHRFPSKSKDNKEAPSVLNNISFVIEPGQKLALIGPTGAGKSTIMKLLLRYMDPTSGFITIDGVDLREIDLNSWWSIVGYIPQEPQIMNGTIRYNLTYGMTSEDAEQIAEDELLRTMKMLQIDFDDLDTNIGYGGVKLSGGQKQRLMIGAAAIKKPKFMVVDEATSSLDATTERLVQEGLEMVLNNRGALIVTHRLNTVRRMCDKFVMVDSVQGSGGHIVAEAENFEGLAKQSTRFRELAKDQGINLLTGADAELVEIGHHAIRSD